MRDFARLGAVAWLSFATGCTADMEGMANPDPLPAALPDRVAQMAPSAALATGQQHFRTGSFGLAAQHFEHASEGLPDNAETWLGLAAAYDRLGRFDLADRAYLEASRLAAPSAAYQNNLGYSFMLRGELAKARRALEGALAADPGNPTVANNLALLASAGGDVGAGAN